MAEPVSNFPEWYVLFPGREAGPFSVEWLKAELAEGRIGPEDLVRKGNRICPAKNFDLLANPKSPAAATKLKQPPATPSAIAHHILMQHMTWVPQLIAILMLLWAFNRGNPYGYYILLRWVCCAIFGFLTFLALAEKKISLAWVLAITAVVYNPFYRVHLDRGTWSIINVITIGIAVGSILAFKMDAQPPGNNH